MALGSGLKSADLKKAPEDWSVKTLEELATIRRGASPRPISDEKWFAERESGIGWIRIGDVTAAARELTRTEQYLSRAGVEKSRRVAPGELIMSICATIGVPKIVGIDACIHDGFVVFRDPDDQLEIEFLRHFIGWKTRWLESLGQPGTQKNLNSGIVKSVAIALPPLPEQRKIAAILSSVDDAIAATRKVIEQTRRVKKGLLQTLMTRGIGHTRFKPVPPWWVTGRPSWLKEIPEDWQVTVLSGEAKLESGHTPARSKVKYWDGDIPWVSLHDTGRLKRRVISETAMSVTQLGLNNSSARLLPEGTVVLSRTATVGLSSIMGRPMATSQDFANYVCGPRVENRFLCQLFRWMSPVWKSLSAGSTHKTVYMPDFEKLAIALPPVNEQRQIADVLEVCDEVVEGREEIQARLSSLKRGLMQDLLTGRVRVQPD